jgi:hypothetical protein
MMRPPAAWTAAVIGFHASVCSAVQIPGVRGQPSPIRLMPMASEMISPALARWL